MNTKDMLRELNNTLEKEKGKKYSTFSTCWDSLLKDVIRKIEELDGKIDELEKENRCLGIDIKNIKSERNRIIKQLEDTNKYLEKENI